MNAKLDATEPEPIVLAFSDGRRYTLETEITRHIWKEVEMGHYRSAEEYIIRAFDAHFSGDIQSGRSKAEDKEP